MIRVLRIRKYTVSAVLLLALAGLLFRLTDAVTLQIAVSVLVGILAFLAARVRKPGSRFPAARPAAVLLLLSALLLTVSALTALFSGRWFHAVCDLVCTVCMALLALSVRSRRAPSFPVCTVLTLALICKLIPSFRAWSVNPHLSDYCFRLFSLLCAMLVSFHLGGFSLSEGKCRLTVFYCICGAVFCFMSIADGGLAEALAGLAYALFLLFVLWSLMQPGRKRQPVPPQNPELPAQ